MKLRLAAALLACLLPLLANAVEADEPTTVFAAASLTDAMSSAGDAFERKTGAKLRFSFASSSTLARQIEAGAAGHLFASANEIWMDYLEQRGLIERGSRTSPISNRLALISPAGVAPAELVVDARLDLPALLGKDGRLAVGDPAHVPAGIYAKQALESLGLWATAEPRLARADNVRAALALVESGEAPLGITYATDAAISDKVEILGYFPESAHTRITYPIALIDGGGGGGDEPRAFLEFLASDEGLAIFESFGFSRAD